MINSNYLSTKHLKHIAAFCLLLFYAFAIQAQTIRAIATCEGITSASENTYNILISGLTTTTSYNFDLDGDGNNEIINYKGATTYRTSVSTNTNLTFTGGTGFQTVQIDENANGSYETQIIVHEVICTDIDNDGTLDFSAGCDQSSQEEDSGYIIATAAPYNSSNTYVYVLTNNTNNALSANTSGVFHKLKSGANGSAIGYHVIAFNFATIIDVQTFINGLIFGANGTLITANSFPNGCATICGSMSYDIECPLAPITASEMSFESVNRLTFSDPCSCNAPRNCESGGVLYFGDTLTIPAMGTIASGLDIRINTSTEFFINAPCFGGLTAPTDGATGTQIMETPAGSGIYKIEFWRPSGTLPTLSVLEGGAITTIPAATFQPICTQEACSTQAANIPTMGEWALCIFGLFILNISLLLINNMADRLPADAL